MKLLTNKQEKSNENAKIYYIYQEQFENKHAKDKKYHKVRNYCHYARTYRSAAHSICNLEYSVLKEIAIVFYNGSNYDYHFTMYVRREEFGGNFICFGDNTQKYITFTVPTEKKVISMNKSRKEITKAKSYR